MTYLEKESSFPMSDYRSRYFHGKWVKHFINDYVDSVFLIGEDSTQLKFSEYKNEHLPKSLYKFYGPSLNSLISLQSESLYLSSPRKFNDPFDSYICIEDNTFVKHYILKILKDQDKVTKEISSDTISENEYWKIRHSISDAYNSINNNFYNVFRNIFESKSEKFRDLAEHLAIDAQKECAKRIDYIRNMEFKVTCFSNFRDERELLENTTMWSHYADNHQGFCVMYSLDFENSSKREEILCGLFPVLYSSVVHKVATTKIMELTYKNDKLELDRSVLKTTLKALTTKSKLWNYEREWRLILSEQNSELLINNAMPFTKANSIYMGCRIAPNLKKGLIQFAGMNNVKIFQTKQSNENFTLYAIEEDVDIESLKIKDFWERVAKISQIEDPNMRIMKISKLNRDFD